MSDREDLLGDLKGQWQQQEVPIDIDRDVVLALVRRNRRAFYGSMLGALVSLLVGLWFWVQDGSDVFRVSAVVMMLNAGVIVVANILLNRTVISWGDWSVAGMLAFRVADCRARARNLTAGICTGVFLIGFAVLIRGVGMDQSQATRIDLSAAIIGVVGALVLFSSWRERRRTITKLAGLEQVVREQEASNRASPD